MATYYKDNNGTHVTVLTAEEHAQCAERDTPMINGWLAESLGGNRITGEYVAKIAMDKRIAANEARNVRKGEMLADGFSLEDIHSFAAEQDAIADFCDAIVAGKIEGKTVTAF